MVATWIIRGFLVLMALIAFAGLVRLIELLQDIRARLTGMYETDRKDLWQVHRDIQQLHSDLVEIKSGANDGPRRNVTTKAK